MKKVNHYETSDLSSRRSDSDNQMFDKRKTKQKHDRHKKSVSSQNSSSSNQETTVVYIENASDNRSPKSTQKLLSKQLSKKHRQKFNEQQMQDVDIEADETDNENYRRKSVDIVVDVHCENEIHGKKLKEKARSRSENSIMRPKLGKHDSKRAELKKVNSQDSLDLIEEIHDSPKSSPDNFIHGNSQTLTNKDKNMKSWMQEAETTSSEVSGRRKRWKNVENGSNNFVDDATKVRRKRWTKMQNGDEEILDNSLSNDYIEVKPKPAPRRSSESNIEQSDKRIMEFDNEGFSPDNEEEVLTIETNYYKQDTKIEMSLTTMNKAEKKKYDEGNMAMIQQDAAQEYDDLSEPSSENLTVQKRAHSSLERRNNFMFEDENMKSLDKKNRSKSADDLGKKRTKSKDRHSSQDTSASFSDDDINDVSKSKKKRSKTKKSHRTKHHSKLESSRKSKVTGAKKQEKEERTKTKEDKEKKKRKKKAELIKFISIKVHKTDMLEIDYVVKHPMVKIHIVNASTGDYVDNDGNSNPEISYLQPIITSQFDFKEHKSLTPVWEEEVIFEHDFRHLFKPEPDNVIIFFEIVDLLTFSEASNNYDKYGSENCWYKIAWAFLKPIGVNDTLHVNKKLRLQLYRPHKPSKNYNKAKCEIFEWWKSKIKKQYPSTLYVTVSSVEKPKLEPIFYDQLTFNDFSDIRSDSQTQYNKTSDSESIPTWTRLAGQSCKIPNDILFETEVSEHGCFYVSFSNNGKYLAYVAYEENNFPIFVYKIEEGRIHVRFNGHKYFVYSLCWSHDDRFLLSVSSDQTARIWDIKEKIIQYLYLLPHPSYVYSGKFGIETSSLIITGCYDKIVRIWAKSKRSKTYDLTQELEAHSGFINAVCFLNSDCLLTADSLGMIISWSSQRNSKKSIKKEWKFFRKIKINEIEGVIINSIFLHPTENKLLVHSRKNSLLLLNLSSGDIIQRYEGLENERIQIFSCISPCGNLVLCGGEDSTLNIWNVESGKLLAKYVIHQTNSIPITCVSYHFFEHMLAFCTFETPSPVKILKFNKYSSGKSVGLIKLADDESFKANLNTSSTAAHSLKQHRSPWRNDSASGVDNEEEMINSESTTNLLVDTESQKSLVMKLQKFIETMPIPQIGNSKKINNIIEKIDRILSNASSSRSADDLESGRHPESLRLDLKSMNSDFSGETVRMQDFETIKRNKRRRPKSAKSLNNSCYSEKLENMRQILSDSAALNKGSMDALVDDEEYNFEEENLENMMSTNLFLDFEESSLSDEKLRKNLRKKDNKDDNLDSDGTYVVEKGDIEKNEDPGSSGDSSVKSNVTFTIENEVPVPKPRKRNNKQQ